MGPLAELFAARQAGPPGGMVCAGLCRRIAGPARVGSHRHASAAMMARAASAVSRAALRRHMSSAAASVPEVKTVRLFARRMPRPVPHGTPPTAARTPSRPAPRRSAWWAWA